MKVGNCLKLLLNYLKLNCVNKSNKMRWIFGINEILGIIWWAYTLMMMMMLFNRPMFNKLNCRRKCFAWSFITSCIPFEPHYFLPIVFHFILIGIDWNTKTANSHRYLINLNDLNKKFLAEFYPSKAKIMCFLCVFYGYVHYELFTHLLSNLIQNNLWLVHL